MKLLNKKKGFTIIELVIVIAVIGILAAVLIPTFIGLTNKANKASDESLVTSLNKALAIDDVDHDYNNMHDAVEGLKRQGFIADTLVTKSGQKLLFSQDSMRFLLEEDKDGGVDSYKYWTIVDNYDAEAEQTYSLYASNNFNVSNISGLKVGFDAGDNKTISSVTYERTSGDAQDKVIIRTNGGDLTINAESDKVSHYGAANVVDIKKVADSSYYEFGTVSFAKIQKGRFVINPDASLTNLHFVKTDSIYNGIKVAVVGNAVLPEFSRDDMTLNNGDKKLVVELQSLASKDVEPAADNTQYVWISKAAGAVSTDVATSPTVLDSSTIVPEASQSNASKTASSEVTEGLTPAQVEEMEEVAERYAGGKGTEASPTLLATKAHFGSLDEDIHDGLTAGKYYKLLKNVDLGDMSPLGWMTLSGKPDAQSYTITGSEAFNGSLDGAGHSLTYKISVDNSYTGSALGLFGSINDAEIKNVTFNADVSTTKSNIWTGAIAGFCEGTDFDNVTVNGRVLGTQDVGGFFGYYGNGGKSSNTIQNCVNNAEVICNSKRTGTVYAPCGGFVGQLSCDYDIDTTLNVINCTNNGKLIIPATTTATFSAMAHFAGFISDAAATGDSKNGHAPANIVIALENFTVGPNATVNSALPFIRQVSNKTVRIGASEANIAVCPAIKYAGIFSNCFGGGAAKVVFSVDGVNQDLTLYVSAN